MIEVEQRSQVMKTPEALCTSMSAILTPKRFSYTKAPFSADSFSSPKWTTSSSWRRTMVTTHGPQLRKISTYPMLSLRFCSNTRCSLNIFLRLVPHGHTHPQKGQTSAASASESVSRYLARQLRKSPVRSVHALGRERSSLFAEWLQEDDARHLNFAPVLADVT